MLIRNLSLGFGTKPKTQLYDKSILSETFLMSQLEIFQAKLVISKQNVLYKQELPFNVWIKMAATKLLFFVRFLFVNKTEATFALDQPRKILKS